MFEPPRHPGRTSEGLPAGTATRSSGGRRRAALAATALAALVLATVASAPRPQAPPRMPRDKNAITKALAAGPHAGDCDQCHTTHGDDVTGPYPNALTSPDDNALCARCHATPWSGGSFAGDFVYRGTGHGSSTRMVWPGPTPPARVEFDAATKCLNCHDPHGMSDAQGEIPQLGLQREEGLCLDCHSGSPAAANIGVDAHKPYRHPTIDYSGRHTGPGESQPSDFGIAPINNRHAECEDCHNPHVSRADANPFGNEASKLTLGVSRVLALNGAAGTTPVYTFVPGADTLTAPVAEFQLCFKCHSSWTTQPTGQTDFGLVLNPANPSYHPVEDIGRNPGIPTTAFTVGWGASSITRCGSCHGADFGSAAGPHGSVYEHLLRQPYSPASAARTMTTDELCFACHAYDVYGNPSAPASTQAASRFNAPGTTVGHAGHVGAQSVPCGACHVTHGSTTLPYLLVTGRSPGLLGFTATPTGGTCTSTCHGAETYQANYAR